MGIMDMLLGEPLKTEGTTWYKENLMNIIYLRSSGLISLNYAAAKIRSIDQGACVRFYFNDIVSAKLRDFNNRTGWATVHINTENKGSFVFTISYHRGLWLDLENKFEL